MFLQLLIGSFLILLTVVIQAVMLDFILKHIRRWEELILKYAYNFYWKTLVMSIVVLAVFTALIVQMWVWAIFYFAMGLFPNMSDALYYSISAFTTVGFGDILLPHNWLLIGGIEAANGFMQFGWSTAFIFKVISRLYEQEGQSIKSRE